MQSRFFMTCIFSLWLCGATERVCNQVLLSHSGKSGGFALNFLMQTIYRKTSLRTNNSLPVWEREKGGVFFVYDEKKNMFSFQRVSNKFDEKESLFANHTGEIIMKCVNLTECPGNIMIRLQNELMTWRYKFQPISETVSNGRKAYKDPTCGAILYFDNEQRTWNIKCNKNHHLHHFYVKSEASKPEFIMENWNVNSSDVVSQYNCVAGQTFQNGTCLNNGIRKNERSGKSWCLCKFGFTGIKCQDRIRDRCPMLDGDQHGKEEGEITSVRCENQWKIASCLRRRNGQLDWFGIDCKWNDKTLLLQTKKNDHLRIFCFGVIFGPTTVLPFLHCSVHFWRRKCLPPLLKIISLYAYIGTFVWTTFILSYHHEEKERTTLSEVSFYTSLLLTLISYPLVVYESFVKSEEMKLLSRTVDNQGRGKNIEELSDVSASMSLNLECFHTEGRNRLLSTSDEQGHVKYHRNFFKRLVISSHHTKKFTFKYTSDEGSLSNIKQILHGMEIAKLKISPHLHFGDVKTEEEFEKEKEKFVQLHKYRDLQYRCSVRSELENLTKIWLYIGKQPPWISRKVYITCIVMWLAWPYRILFNIAVPKVEFTVKKSVSNVAYPGSEIKKSYLVC